VALGGGEGFDDRPLGQIPQIPGGAGIMQPMV